MKFPETLGIDREGFVNIEGEHIHIHFLNIMIEKSKEKTLSTKHFNSLRFLIEFLNDLSEEKMGEFEELVDRSFHSARVINRKELNGYTKADH